MFTGLLVVGGRRPKNGDKQALHENLFEWLQQRRPDKYHHVGGPKIHLNCLVCGERVAAMRNSTIFFVLQHEAHDTHHQAEMKMAKVPCRGINVAAAPAALEHKTPAHDLRASLVLWASHGCPWHAANYTCRCDVRGDSTVLVQCTKCVDSPEVRMCSRSRPFCRSCYGLCCSREFCSKISAWAYRIELAELTQATFLENDSARRVLLDRMAAGDWQKYYPVNIGQLDEMTYPELHDKLSEVLVSIPKSLHTAAVRKFMVSQFSWLPRHIHEGTGGKGQKGLVLQHVDLLLQAKRLPGMDGSLCQQIVSGALDGNDVARTMICGILNKAQRQKSGKKRLCTSSLPLVDETRIAELGSALSSCTGQDSLLSMFGYCAPRVSGDSWRHNLPMFYAPTAAEIRRNAELVLQLYDRPADLGRDFMVAFDDTVYWPQYSLQSFPEPAGMCFVGGCEEKAKIPCANHQPGSLQKCELSQTCVSYLLKRASSRKQPFDICMLPRRLKSVTRQSVMENTARVLQSVTEAAQKPPIAVAFDNHAAHQPLSAFYLGLLPAARYKDLPFFGACQLQPRLSGLPLWLFTTPAWGGHVIFAANDAGHCQKCLTRAIRVRSRTLQLCQLYVWPQTLLMRGCPASAWRGTDNQSDVQSAWLLNPQAVDVSQWDSYGLVVYMFMVSHWCSVWLSSHAWEEGGDLLHSCLVGYYFILFDMFESGGDSCTYFHATTVGNILAIVGHLVERMTRWPEGCPFRPSASTEDSCEHHFARTKGGVRFRLPTIRAAITSTQHLHLQQSKNIKPPDEKKLTKWRGLSDDQIAKAGQEALQCVCTFKAVASVGRSPEDMKAALTNWWEVIGKHAVAERFQGKDGDEDEEAHSDDEDEIPNAEHAGQETDIAQTLSCLEWEAQLKADMDAKADETTQQPLTQEPLTEKSNLEQTSRGQSDTAEPKEDLSQMQQLEGVPMSLRRLLEMHGFSDYKPLQGDTEHAMLSRLHKLLPDMLKFVTRMRLAEGFLRPSQVMQPKKPLSAWNQLQKDLAEAQRSFGLQGARQGRAASWYGFAKLVAERANEAASEVEGRDITGLGLGMAVRG